VQNALGADIIMAFDECPPGDAPREYHATALERTLRWADLCVAAHARADDQSLFGIVQGGTDLDLRGRCAEQLIKLDLPGYAIGGLAVGEGFEGMKTVLRAVTPALPEHKPRYLMGVGFRGHRGGRLARGGHVRLRDAHAQRPQRVRVTARRDPAAQQRVPARRGPDRRRGATVTRVARSEEVRSGTFFSRARCLAPSSFRCIIFGSTNA
jgi:hypothetical protein